MADAQSTKRAHNFKDLSGMQFGRWTVLELGPKNARGQVRWHCLCECGSRSIVLAACLTSGNSRGCNGCKKTRPGMHGQSSTPEYKVWTAMVQRCTNPKCRNWHNYGGRGIKVCDRWKGSFENFIADMGIRPSDKHSLDREKNDGDYEPTNCRWATKKVQVRNTRLTRMLEIDGITRPLIEWSEISGINKNTIDARLKIGMDAKSAVFSPPTACRHRERDSLGRVVCFALE